MDNKDIAKEWFDIADTDLTSAEFYKRCDRCHAR